jgi:Mg-chelatase subunit ChlD
MPTLLYFYTKTNKQVQFDESTSSIEKTIDNSSLVNSSNEREEEKEGKEDKIKTNSIPEIKEISIEKHSQFHSVVSIIANQEKEADKTIKLPMDIVVVLDVSGSMGCDNKLINVKHAVSFIRGELKEDDKMGVIKFEHDAHIVHDLQSMNNINKINTDHLIKSIRSGGGTNILSGLQIGYEMLLARKNKNPISSLFLLTDGLDNSNLQQKLSLAKKIRELGCSLFIYGFGNDHDSNHLKQIVDAGEGLFTFIEKSDMVMDAFGGALGAEKSIFARDLCLTINTTNNCTITSAATGNYRNVISNCGKTMNVYFNNLMMGEKRDILLSILVPKVANETHNYQLFTSNISYMPLDTLLTTPISINGDDCIISRLNKSNIDPNIKKNIIVDFQINRMLLSEATQKSLNLCDDRDFATAKKILNDALNFIKMSISYLANYAPTLSLVEDLTATLYNIRDDRSYFLGGGRATTAEGMQSSLTQRCTYSKASSPGSAMYQNFGSATFQNKALHRKSANK